MTRLHTVRPSLAPQPALRTAPRVVAQAAAPVAPAKPEVNVDVDKEDLQAFAPTLQADRYALAVAANAVKAKQSERERASAEFGKALEAAKRLTGDNSALYQARVTRLEGYLSEAETKLAQARTPGLVKAQTLESEAGRLGAELSAAQNKLTATRNRIQWLNQDIGHQESRRDQAERNKSAAESDIRRLESQVSPSMISSQEYRVRQAQSDVSRAQSKVSSANSEVNSLESRISSIESQISSLQGSTDPGAASKISSLRSELSGVKSRLSSAESTLSHARYELSDAEGDLRRERSELSRLEGLMRDLENARSRRSSAIREIDAAETELAAHHREVPQQVALVPVVEQQITATQSERDELLKRAQALRGPKNAEGHPQVAEARQAVENLKKELAIAKKTFDDRTADPRAELAAAQQLFDAQMAPHHAAVTEAEQALTVAQTALKRDQDALADLARHVGGWTKFTWRLSGFNLDAFMAEALKA